MSTEIDTSWVVQGAEVLAYHKGRAGTSASPRYVVIGKVAGKSFLVEGIPERFDLATLETKPSRDRYTALRWAITPVDSEKARELLAQERVDRLRTRAILAVSEWDTGSGRDDKDKTWAAVAALGAYLEVL